MSRVNYNGSLKCQIPLTDANAANYNWAGSEPDAVLADISLADGLDTLHSVMACWVTVMTAASGSELKTRVFFRNPV